MASRANAAEDPLGRILVDRLVRQVLGDLAEQVLRVLDPHRAHPHAGRRRSRLVASRHVTLSEACPPDFARHLAGLCASRCGSPHLPALRPPRDRARPFGPTGPELAPEGHF